jgi:hypothetical protein
MQSAPKRNLNAGLIGQRLVEAGYLTREQLQEALSVQRETALLLGEVCILRGWLTFEQLQACLRPVRSRLGNKLLQSGRITMEQLWLAILEQRKSGRRLGDILVDRGWVDAKTLESL